MPSNDTPINSGTQLEKQSCICQYRMFVLLITIRHSDGSPSPAVNIWVGLPGHDLAIVKDTVSIVYWLLYNFGKGLSF